MIRLLLGFGIGGRILFKFRAPTAQWKQLQGIARQDWVAVLDKQGQIQGFLRSDGF